MTSISGGISFNGLGSDSLDYEAIINQEKSIKEIPKKRLQAWYQDWGIRYDAFDKLLTGVQELSTKLSSMGSSRDFLQKNTSVAHEAIATVTANAKAVDGAHSIDVKQLATNAVLTSNHIFASKDEVITGAEDVPSFSYTYKGKTHSINIPQGCDLAYLVTKINGDQQNPGVTASLLQTDGGYLFMLQGNDTGTDAKLSIDSATTLPMFQTNDYWYTRSGSTVNATDLVNKTGTTYTYTIADKDNPLQRHELTINPNTTAKELVTKINDLTGKTGIKASLELTDAKNTALGYDLKLTDKDENDVSANIATLLLGGEQKNLSSGNTLTGTTSPSLPTPPAKGLHFTSMTDNSGINRSSTDKPFKLQDIHSNTITIDTQGGDTVSDLVSKINEQTKTTGIKASLYTDTSGTYMQLERSDGKAMGPYGIGNNTSLSALDGANWNRTQADVGIKEVRAAQDAKYTLDGISIEGTSSSNTLTDIFPGVNITMNSEGTTSFTITTSTEDTKKKIEEFVDAYNELMDLFDEVDNYDENKEIESRGSSTDDDGNYTISYKSQFVYQKGGVLTGNYGMQTIRSELKQLVSGNALGFSAKQMYNSDGSLNDNAYGDPFTSLSSIGIIVDSNESSKTFGHLKFMTDNERIEKGGSDDKNNPYKTLDMALSEDADAVIDLLVGSGGSTNDSHFSYRGSLGGSSTPQGGDYKVEYEITQNGVLPNEITIGGYTAKLDTDTKTYTVPAGSPIAGVEISIDDMSAGKVSNLLHIREGKIPQLASKLKDELKETPVNVLNQGFDANFTRGSLIILKENYQTIMQNIQDKIDKETSRIQTWEKRERQKYSRLDTLLGTYNNQMTSNSAQFSQLSSGSSSS